MLLFGCQVMSDFSWPPWAAAQQTSLSLTISQSLPKFMSIELVMPPNHLILCHPFILLPLIFPSIRIFPNEIVFGIRWSKYWSFSFSISPSAEYSGLISFKIDCFDLLAFQRTLKNLKPMKEEIFPGAGGLSSLSSAYLFIHQILFKVYYVPSTVLLLEQWIRPQVCKLFL